MSNTNHSALRTVITLFVSALIIGLSVWVFFNRQYLLDSYTNMTYQPSADIAAITERTQLTDKGRFTFYATNPEVLGQESFNQRCPRQEAGSPILGCYTNDRIYMYDVTNERLDGMKEVTAVHEILHAVWTRTNEEEQGRLGAQLRAAYESKADDTLKARMDYYERTEPGQFTNELHAILGTEMSGLGNELEAYYAQFFDRATVLALHSQYNTAYTQLSSRADELFTLMGQLAEMIDETSDAYNSNAQRFSNEVDAFNSRAENGEFASTAQFNAERSQLVARSNQLEADRRAINANIETYNQYYAEYQTISEQIEVLNSSMDSYRTLDEAPSV
jgi:hypothetical protein